MLREFCETQWPRPPLFSPSWVIQWIMGEGLILPCFHRVTSLRFTGWSMGGGGGVLYNLVFTEWRHCVSQNMKTWSEKKFTFFKIATELNWRKGYSPHEVVWSRMYNAEPGSNPVNEWGAHDRSHPPPPPPHTAVCPPPSPPPSTSSCMAFLETSRKRIRRHKVGSIISQCHRHLAIIVPTYGQLYSIQQKWEVGPMLFHCWHTVYNAALTVNQRWAVLRSV